jgi:hypothetical protein
MTKKTAKSLASNNLTRCLHRHPSNRRCRLAISDKSSYFCDRHAHLPPPTEESQKDFSEELAPDIKKFTTAKNINKFLATLLQLLAQDRITPRRGAVLAYTCNLLLRTLPAIEHELHPDTSNQPIIWDMPKPDYEYVLAGERPPSAQRVPEPKPQQQ